MLLDDERFVLDPALALTPEELEAQPSPIPPELNELINRHVLTTDGDDHRRLRRLVAKAFTPKMVEQLRPRIQVIADGLIDDIEEKGEADLVDSYAFPLPIIVIAELLGIPAVDRDRFRVWSNTFVSPSLGEDALDVFLEHTQQFLTYLTQLFERRRADPADDLVSALLQAEEQGDSLKENELFSMMILLIIAGHETTVSLIANAVLALLTHPEELERLRRDPALVPAAVEELLRYESPVERTITRWAATDVRAWRTLDRARRARHRGAWDLRTATRAASRTPTSSISTARTFATSDSGAASTSASARRSPESKPRSR